LILELVKHEEIHTKSINYKHLAIISILLKKASKFFFGLMSNLIKSSVRPVPSCIIRPAPLFPVTLDNHNRQISMAFIHFAHFIPYFSGNTARKGYPWSGLSVLPFILYASMTSSPDASSMVTAVEYCIGTIKDDLDSFLLTPACP
jgi:hypothetical protein